MGAMRVLPLFTEHEVQQAVRRVAGEVLAHLGEQEPVMVLCLLNGALWYTADLLRHLPVNYELSTVRVASYEGASSSGELTWYGVIPDCRGRRVLVVDDVLDTGITLQAVSQALLEQGAAAVCTTVALHKRGCAKVDFTPDFVALCCDDVFLVGYGLDYNGKYRNLPYVGYVEFESNG